MLSAKVTPGVWIPAYFGPDDSDHVVDVTGAGNAFLGGLVAGLSLTHDDLVEGELHNIDAWSPRNSSQSLVASLYAAVSASYTIEQKGLPRLTGQGSWNDSQPKDRLHTLKQKIIHGKA